MQKHSQTDTQGFTIIGLTGPMASGKNAVADILEKHGYPAVDADLLAHKAIELAAKQIIERFSEDAKKLNINFVNTDGSINRRQLGKLLFSKPELLEVQEKIIHPIVNEMILAFIEEMKKEASNKDVTTQNKISGCVLNATLLYKVPVITQCNKVIFVTASFFTRLKRAKKRDNLSIFQILKRFYSQKNLFSKYNFLNSDIYKVNNNMSLQNLEEKILKIL
jgi:dephospho-CoA kinase